MNNIKKITIALISILIIIPLMGIGYIYFKLNSMYDKEEAKQINTTEESERNKKNGITNILLVGVDGNNMEKGNRSDAMMIATIDEKNNDIRITSLARDTYVDIPGYSTEKLTHAYAYEGIDLLKEVFKVNFDLDIDKYIAVNFSSFMEIIDEIGGVVVDVPESGLESINSMIDACYNYYSDKDSVGEKEYLTHAGTQRLNGYQALAFSRIRYTDSAFHREARHREVAESVYKEFAQKGVETYKKCAEIILNNTKTNISPIEMMNLAYTVLKINDKDIEQFQFPLEEYRNGHIINKQKGWVLEWDKEPNLEAWHKFIFGEEK